MAKIVIMKGLPASGKSTAAKDMVEAGGNIVRLNKDLLRTMLHYDKFSGTNERTTQQVEAMIAQGLLAAGTSVIIDDTNLNPKTVDNWKRIAESRKARIEYQDFTNVSVETCLLRDKHREKKVGPGVIMGMAMQYDLFTPEKGYVIVDIDGTVADIAHRRHFVEQQPKNWQAFFQSMHADKPRTEVIKRVREFMLDDYDVIFVSGRPDTYRKVTEEWLRTNVGIEPIVLMRDGRDSRPDTEVKKDILDRYFKDKKLIKLVIDDRPSVIRMWRDNGLTVEDVGDGVEF